MFQLRRCASASRPVRAGTVAEAAVLVIETETGLAAPPVNEAPGTGLA